MPSERLYLDRDIAALPLFSFRKRGAPSSGSWKFPDGNRLDVVYPRGPLMAFDFRVFHELMIMASEHGASHFSQKLSFVLFEFARRMGFSKTAINGKLYQRLHDSFLRLFATQIQYSGKQSYRQGNWLKWRETFTLLSRISERLLRQDQLVRLKYEVEISSILVDAIRHQHHYYCQVSHFRSLDSDIARSLLIKLIPGLHASAASGVFKKRYSEVCENWLQMTSFKTPSEARRQLGHFGQLKELGVIESWDIEHSPRGLILVIKHGKTKKAVPNVDSSLKKQSGPSVDELLKRYEMLRKADPEGLSAAENSAVGPGGSRFRRIDAVRRYDGLNPDKAEP